MRSRGLMTLPAGEPVRMMIYHDAAASLPGERKLNGFFLHFLQFHPPGSACALLPFAVLHGNDTKAAFQSFFADHPVSSSAFQAEK